MQLAIQLIEIFVAGISQQPVLRQHHPALHTILLLYYPIYLLVVQHCTLQLSSLQPLSCMNIELLHGLLHYRVQPLSQDL